MRSFFIALLLSFLFFDSNSQELAVDSKGEPVFQFYSINDARIQFNRRSPISASYVFGSKAKPNSGILLQVSVLNSGDFSLIQKLKDIRPGAGVKLGYQNTVGQFSTIDLTRKTAHAWGVNAFFNIDNLKLYDTVERIAAKKYPLSYGIEANYTVVLKNSHSTGNWKKAFSIYTAVGSTWNDHNLLSYQQVSKVTIRPDVVAMQDFDGRYGVLRENFLKSRTVISFPLFYKRLNATPYWAGVFGTQNSPSYHMGVFSNLLASSLNKSNSKMPSTFGVGFDWVYATEHLPAKVNVFIKAAISFGRLKE